MKAGITNPKFQQNNAIEQLTRFQDWMIYDIPPGPNFIPMKVYVNGHKATMLFYILGLMMYYDNWTITAYIYLAMHGSYGFFWFLKDQVFPDAAFAKKTTLMSFLMPWPIALIPYMFSGYWICKDRVEASNERIFCALFLYMNGVMLMMLTDAQKYLVLREKKGLITHGMMGWTRNMNYVGEMMLYGSFGVLLQRFEYWLVLSYMWGIIFVIRMTIKDYSLSKKEGWDRYSSQTWMLIPKLFNSFFVSLLVYGLFIAGGWYTYTNGGIEKTLKQLL